MREKVTLTCVEEIEQWLYDHNVQLIEDNSLLDYECFNKAFTVKYKDAACLVYAPGAILNNTEKRVVLLHEIYHLVIKNGFYYLNDSPYKRKMVEGRVRNRMVKDIIPFNQLVDLIKKNYSNYEIAEELQVTEELLNDAYQVYEGKFIESNLTMPSEIY